MQIKIKLIVGIISFCILTACGAIPIVTPLPTLAPTLASILPTETAQPTTLPSPTATLAPTETPFPTPAPAKGFLMENLRIVYSKDGNLYLQNGTNQPIQLTNSEQDRDPIISADGAKIVFYRGENQDNIHSINADGSQEKELVLSKKLPALGQGTIRALTFVPGTHKLVFNTYICESQTDLYRFASCSVSIFSVDADTGNITQLQTGLGGHSGQIRERGQDANFAIAPNGIYFSVANAGHIDLVDLSDGNIGIPDIVQYTRTEPNEFLPRQYWLPDSSALISVVPVDHANDPTSPPSVYAVWRYSSDRLEEPAVQIPFEPPVMFSGGCDFSVSPNRNWIIFVSEGIGINLGNLKTGETRIFDENSSYCPSIGNSSPRWSPDSQHFVETRWDGSTILADLEGNSFEIDGNFIDWIDASHYFYSLKENDVLTTYIKPLDGDAQKVQEGYELATFVYLQP